MHVRIVCRWPKQPPPHPIYGVQLVQLPTIHDVEVLVVDDDGTERPLEGVTRIGWEIKDPSEIPVAHLEVHGVEVDLATLPCRKE